LAFSVFCSKFSFLDSFLLSEKTERFLPGSFQEKNSEIRLMAFFVEFLKIERMINFLRKNFSDKKSSKKFS